MRASSEITELMEAGRELTPATSSVSVPDIAIGEIYRKHGDMVLRRAAAILGDRNEAMDVLHQIFLSLIDHPERFEGRSSVTTWLYRVTTNTCLNRLRDRRNRARLIRELVEPVIRPHQPEMSLWVMARQLIERMPLELAQVTIYHAIDGMTQEEIAEILGCSRRHVGHLLERAARWASALDEVAT
jgi:RNA polymerase sigma factor (sigma-70 family)